MHDATSPRSDQSRSTENLKRLLLRFDPDPTRAGERYEAIRRRLTKFFEWNMCRRSEDLADEVFDRVAVKLESEEIRELDKYCFGVARFVCREAYKKMHRETQIEDLTGEGDALVNVRGQSAQVEVRLYQERRLECLRQCLARLTAGDRELVIQYYSAEGEKQKTFRQKLAEKTGLKLGTLRVRINRVRGGLRDV